MTDNLNEKYPITKKREDGALRNFKQVMREIIHLLRQSADMETVLVYWINRSREQFVLESAASKHVNTSFRDRIPFEESYLYAYRDIKEATIVEVGKDVSAEALKHYSKDVPVKFIYLLPFESNGEIVAITVLESHADQLNENQAEAFQSFHRALANLLYTFLELNDLSKSEEEWVEYEDMIESLNTRDDHIAMIDKLLSGLQSFVLRGGVSLLARGQDEWQVVLNSPYAIRSPSLGTIVEENSIAYEALKTGRPEFTIHFNSNPRRVAVDEPLLKGATLAVPILLQDRRQAVILIYDENLLIFKESNKHKMVNLVRIAALRMMSSKNSYQVNTDILIADNGAFHTELIERIVQRQMKRSPLFPDEKCWLGLITIEQLSELRTRLRIDELKDFQKRMVSEIAPLNYGLHGIVGSHADYVYAIILQGTDDSIVTTWREAIEESFSEPFAFLNDVKIKITVSTEFVQITDFYKNADEVFREAKKGLNASFKKSAAG